MHRRKAALPAKARDSSSSASVSPGNPTIRSVVRAQPGKLSRRRATLLRITGGVILPAHPDKDGVAAGLETQVELGAQVGEGG